MQAEEQIAKVKVSVGIGAEQVDLYQCEMQMKSKGIQIRREKCRITVPYANITSCGKNQLTLLLFTSDPDNGLSPDEEGEEEQQNNLDRVLLKMLKTVVNQGKGSFDNVLKGSFTIAITHPTQGALVESRSTIQAALASMEPQVQTGFAMASQDMSD